MYPIYHLVLTIIMSGFLYPILGWKIALFWLGSFFIDVDHYWWYIIKFKDLSLKSAYIYGKDLSIKDVKLHILHTVEFWILLGIWSIYNKFIFVIFFGLVFHVIIDITDMIARDLLHRRFFSFFSWIYSL